jgi:hypothetical protein
MKAAYHFALLSIWWLVLFFLGCGRDVVYAAKDLKKGAQ